MVSEPNMCEVFTRSSRQSLQKICACTLLVSVPVDFPKPDESGEAGRAGRSPFLRLGK